ncbi:MAG: PucR family transcriptional regulator [Solirubrobacterales bacterium]
MGGGNNTHKIAARLRARREEVEHATLRRVYGISEPSEALDPEYLHGLHASVAAAVEYALVVLEVGGKPPAPASLLDQARLAARNRVPLDVVLRRYFFGFLVICDFLLEEAHGVVLEQGGQPINRLMGEHIRQLDRLLAAVADAYRQEVEACGVRAKKRDVRRVERVLAGEPLDVSDLAYDFNGWHVGMAIIGEDAKFMLQSTADALDRALLYVEAAPGTTWAWLAGRQRLEAKLVAERLQADLTLGIGVALGEPSRGLQGWRLTHRQAIAVVPLLNSSAHQVVLYSDLGVLASISRDDVLVKSLHELYVVPLSDGSDAGVALRQTLLTYLSAGRNITSTSAALGINRQTVRRRLREAEEKLGRSLDECAAELEFALRLKDARMDIG